MNMLSPTSVLEAGQVMAPHLGYDWEQNRSDVVKGVNRFRNHLYNKYNQRKLFDDVFHCVCPQDFPLECLTKGKCKSFYRGITLPNDVAGVVKAWQCGIPLKIRSRWREAFTGRVSCGSEMSLVMLPQRFPTEREFTAATPLRFYAEHAGDAGKVVFMEAMMRGGKTQRLRFDLKSDEWVQSADPVYKILNVTLPEGLKGYLTLATENGYDLSVYAPWERVPSYARVKFLTGCSTNVFIQGTRQYAPVYFDPDIVEVGDNLVMEFMAQYIRHSMARDQRDKDTAATALVQANEQLDGLISRNLAGAIQDGPRKVVKIYNVLPGYGRHCTRPANTVAVAPCGVSFSQAPLASSCTTKFSVCARGHTGPQGPEGPQGPMGQTGPPGPGAEQEIITDGNGNRWLKVNDSGTFRYSQLFDEIPV